MRTRLGAVEPEVRFRIIHYAQMGHHGAPVATYRDQPIDMFAR